MFFVQCNAEFTNFVSINTHKREERKEKRDKKKYLSEVAKQKKNVNYYLIISSFRLVYEVKC